MYQLYRKFEVLSRLQRCSDNVPSILKTFCPYFGSFISLFIHDINNLDIHPAVHHCIGRFWFEKKSEILFSFFAL